MNLEHTYANCVDNEGVAKIQALEKELGDQRQLKFPFSNLLNSPVS